MKISDLRKNRFLLRQLRWDLKPEDIFKPRFVTPETDRRLRDETTGIMFYIDHVKGLRPSLKLMRTVEMMSSTLGEVEDVPEELLTNAVGKAGRNFGGMYPIDEELESWLKKELGVTA